MRTALIVVAAMAALAACGKQGALERPNPIFGDPAPSQPAPSQPGQKTPAK